MKRYLVLTLAIAGFFAAGGQHLLSAAAAHNQHHEKNAFTPDTIPWGPAPPVVRPPGYVPAAPLPEVLPDNVIPFRASRGK